MKMKLALAAVILSSAMNANASTLSNCIDDTGVTHSVEFISDEEYVIYDGNTYEDVGAISHDVQGIIMYKNNDKGLFSVYVTPTKVKFTHMNRNNEIDAVGSCSKGIDK